MPSTPRTCAGNLVDRRPDQVGSVAGLGDHQREQHRREPRWGADPEDVQVRKIIEEENQDQGRHGSDDVDQEGERGRDERGASERNGEGDSAEGPDG